MSSVIGLEMPNAWRTGQAQDANFDISADQLNLTLNRQLWIPTSTIDWAGTLMQNALDPVSPQDLATKNYADINGGTLWSTFPAIQAVDMDSNFIQNLLDPILAQDAVTKNYVDTQGFATELNELSDVTILTPINLDLLQFNSTSGQWENKPLVVPAGNSITQGDSSVTVIDTGVGIVETVIDGALQVTVGTADLKIQIPVLMNLQQIRNLGTPSVDTDASTKLYVDEQIATLPTDLNGLTDVTITTPLVNQFLVNNGSGQFINQLITPTQLPLEVAYTDVANIFTLNNVFTEGLQLAPDKNLDIAGGQILDNKFMDLIEQVSDPPDPILTNARIFFDSAVTFGSPNPLLAVLINRDGVIEKKPIVTSETVFALNQFSNGMFTEETGVRLSDNNPTIRVQMFNEIDVNTIFDVVLEGEIFEIPSPDVSITTANTIDLTEGTDTVPVLHYVWIELQAGAPIMVSSTVSFPQGQDFAVVGKFLFQSRVSMFANIATGDPYAVNSPDYEIKDADIRGHLAHINDRLVNFDASYLDGIVLTVAPIVGGGTDTTVVWSSTAGRAYELHLEDIEAFDITTLGSIALVQNEGNKPDAEVTPITNLGDDLAGLICANDATVMWDDNNQIANIVIYTVHSDAEPNLTNYAVNLPFDTYANDDAAAIADSSGFAITNVPLTLRGIALLVAEVVIKFTNGPLYEVLAVKDLRGQVPGAAGGSGGGSQGATQLDDLSDVTINTPLLNESLINDGAGQWINKLTPQLETPNTWTNYQDFVAIAEPLASIAGVGRMFVETLDASNDGLFIWLNVAGAMTKVRLT